MKTGRDLKEIAAEVFRQQETKRDYVAPAKSLRLAVAEPPAGSSVAPVVVGGVLGRPSSNGIGWNVVDLPASAFSVK